MIGWLRLRWAIGIYNTILLRWAPPDVLHDAYDDALREAHRLGRDLCTRPSGRLVLVRLPSSDRARSWS